MNYTQIGNVFHLCNRIEPFAALFWALGIVHVLAHILKQLTQPAGPASLNSGTGTVLYGRFNLRVKTGQLLAFPILLYIIYLCSHPTPLSDPGYLTFMHQKIFRFSSEILQNLI